MLTLAHFSDAHLVAPLSRRGWLLNGKQALALGNWWWRRRWRQRQDAVRDAVRAILDRRADLALVTGDHAQIGRAVDYEFFYEQIKPLRAAKIPVLLLRGNHDYYSSFARAYRFFDKMRAEASLSLRWDGAPLRLNDLDIIPVDGACATPAFQCWGSFPLEAQNRLRATLEKLPARAGQTRLACGHFPLRGPRGEPLPDKTGLRGAEAALALLQDAGTQAYLCGHIHRPFTVSLPGGIPQYCAGSLTIGGTLQFFRCGGGEVTPLP